MKIIPRNDAGENKDSSTVLRFSVRDFVAFVYRRGSLNTGNFFSLLDGLGIKTHQQFFKAFRKSQPDATIFSEYSLKTTFVSDSVKIEVQGRADLIVLSENNEIQIIEIKTIAKDSADLPVEADFLHIAQARIYAYIFCKEKEITNASIQVTVKYILINSFKIKDFNETVTYNELEKFSFDTCNFYIAQGLAKKDYSTIRDLSIKALTFPYSELRQGQKEFMNAVLSCMRKHEPLLVSAPTGTGKTISVLYPAIKGIPQKYCDYIFYITAKNSTAEIAKKTLDDMRGNGLVIKSIHITAKEKVCLCKEIYCDTSICPYAVNYYDNYSKAMNELSSTQSIDFNVLMATGEVYGVCPFELGLDLSLFCDIIICDYNYIFDPKVSLERFVKQEAYNFAILIDEAHNLPDRACEMYSAEMSYKELKEVLLYKSYFQSNLQNIFDELIAYYKVLLPFIKGEENLEEPFDKSILLKELFWAENFGATRKLPKDYVSILEKLVQYAKEDLNSITNTEARKALKNLYFSAKFFIRTSSEFFDDSYIVTFEKSNRDLIISLRCMDSSGQIDKFHQGKHSLVFFSATLSPVQYFESRFKSVKNQQSINKIILPSPFPKENLFVGIIPSISTKYNNRQSSLKTIADVVEAAVSSKMGNYIVYSPSFEYQKWIVQMVEMVLNSNEINRSNGIKIITQTPSMNEIIRDNFLKEFREYGKRTLIAFAVLGGVFGEGIDLVGETLSGVIIVGVGLPRKSPERDIMADYYSNMIGNGFDFAYRYPGFNKIQQAAGRVIRSEEDRGFILLLDERYEKPDYQMLFPEEWHPIVLRSKSQIKNSIKEFLM